jgi:porphobilinogen synthase
MKEDHAMTFPEFRFRRLRDHPVLREMVAETDLAPRRLIQPLFVKEGLKGRKPIRSMPGQAQLDLKELAVEARRARQAGVPAVLLFGIPRVKDAVGSAATQPDGIIPQAIRAIKDKAPDVAVIADVCLCEYTDHGHCGVLTAAAGPAKARSALSLRQAGRGTPRVTVDNDATLGRLAEMAVVCAQAGADVVAPSDMMDGRVRAIREALDEAGLAHVPIMSYAAKFASSFYGPFREAAESPPRFGDRRGYQMDLRNADEAVREAAADVDEGADILIVKPALAYGDVIRRIKDALAVPVAAYNVSGEYAMVEAAARAGWVLREAVIREVLLGLRRAGADLLITYWATEVAEKMKA